MKRDCTRRDVVTFRWGLGRSCADGHEKVRICGATYNIPPVLGHGNGEDFIPTSDCSHLLTSFDLPIWKRPLPGSKRSKFRMIVDLFCAIFKTIWSGVKAAVHEAKDWIKNIAQSPPSGHTIVNGELNVSLFEHRVKRCECLENYVSSDTYHHYKLEVEGLEPTTVTFASPASSLMDNSTQYYLCRPWDRRTQNVFQIFLELIEYIFKDEWKEIWSNNSESEGSMLEDEVDNPESRLREEMEMKRKEVLRFFTCPGWAWG
ncbi:hypothetical protein J3R83DRAFT_7870 [Lanmaoa asiatica]|nr:hypothetical protein J3R83DRAFT_7870 [Lanmaoa asiatica]